MNKYLLILCIASPLAHSVQPMDYSIKVKSPYQSAMEGWENGQRMAQQAQYAKQQKELHQAKLSQIKKETTNKTSRKDMDETVKRCSGFAEIAKSAVEARQNRVPATTMYKTLINQDEDTQTLLKIALDSAYRTPLATSEEEKVDIILEHTNQSFEDCMKFLTANN